MDDKLMVSIPWELLYHLHYVVGLEAEAVRAKIESSGNADSDTQSYLENLDNGYAKQVNISFLKSLMKEKQTFNTWNLDPVYFALVAIRQLFNLP